MRYFAAVFAALTVLMIALGLLQSDPSRPAAPFKGDTIYIRNLAPQFFSDAQIKNDIPAWEDVMNKDFAPAWQTPQFRFIFIGRAQAPKGEMVATFVKRGPIKGALAYHSVEAGVPSITVYSGTSVYYGYDVSVDFTHEAEELAADASISVLNQGYYFDHITVGDKLFPMPASVWAQEVSDPVEAYSYTRPGANGKPVKCSDFITRNWFNDHVNGGYDFMHLVQEPFTVLPGGYAQFFDGFSWNVVEDFSGTPGEDGFLRGEQSERK